MRRSSIRAVWAATVALVLAVAAAVLSSLPALPATVLAVLVYGAVALALRAVPPELRDLLPRR